ncbi:F-box domain, Leucine-rich repeat domain, L domain-like protein [Artemisia annua]|uniref:F-box domain, Leucine-rich repeat domain, L domain-like protein n=1 Tax=Artemisia annua TaxID=35608 RepID=A0A2U1NEV7_ARTAN|nr:F-box domain, Leucine-rich repeat domain, L domain-like protein [Artemisia annua]
MESIIVDTRDRISQLPESIIHHILSYLYSPKDLVRMSILSTYWFGITASFPILIFNFSRFKEVLKSSGIPYDTKKDISDTFFKYVKYTVSRFYEQNVSVHTFNLNTSSLDPTEVDIINRCLEMTIKKGVKVLVININYWAHLSSHPHQRYCVPNILLTATSLTSLTLSNCVLPLSLMVDVKFKCLKLLCLSWITLNDEVIKRLTTSCPLLEELAVIYCVGLKRFCVHGLLYLQKVQIQCRREVERIEIDAPNLCYICLSDSDDTDDKEAPPSMNLASCKKLTKVCYHGIGLPGMLSNFPFIEDLFLHLPDECERLNMSNHSLRTFMLDSKCEFDKIDVDTPNLQLFGFTDDSCNYSRMKTNQAPSKACIKWDCDVFINDHWFQELRQFLDKKTRFKELKLHINVGCVEPIEREVIQWPPIEFEHVELEAKEFEIVKFYLRVVNGLLWCCRPQSLTLIIDFSLLKFEEWESVVKKTYEKLLQQEDQAHTNIQFLMSSSSSKAKMNFSDLSTLLKALPRDGSKQTITFVKNKSCSRSRKRKPSKVSESISEDESIADKDLGFL